LNKYTTVIIR